MTAPRERARDTVLGNERRIGLWIVPLFLIVALIGATLAGGVVTLYYSQQVRQLEATTADARQEVQQAEAEITATASEAKKTLNARVQQAREALAHNPPIGSPNDAGIFAVSADHAGGEVRVGSAFAISSGPDQTFLATTYSLVATRTQAAVPTARVFLEDGVVTAEVHNYDRQRDLATLKLDTGPLPVPEWRPADPQIGMDATVYLAGIAGPGTPVVMRGRVGGVSEQAIVATTPVNSFLAGAPLLDAQRRVVGIASLAYAPFGPVRGDPIYAVPVRGLCARVVECTAGGGATQGLAEGGEVGEGPAPGQGNAQGPRAEPPAPPPEPSPSGSGSDRQSPSQQQPAR